MTTAPAPSQTPEADPAVTTPPKKKEKEIKIRIGKHN
jgi:hypothetical protein